MGKLRETLMNFKLPTAVHKKQPFSLPQVPHIQQGLHESVPPALNAPTFASMIYKAIIELNEEGGSTEESISEYMNANYEDLPHRCYLSHHLSELCDKGFVVYTSSERYLIPGLSDRPICMKGQSKRNWMNRTTCKENSLEDRLSEEDNSFENEEFKAMNERNTKQARCVLVTDVGNELLEFDSNAIEDERIISCCKTQLVEGHFQQNQEYKLFEIIRKPEETFHAPNTAPVQGSLDIGYSLGFGFSELEQHYIESFEEQVMFHEQYNAMITNLCLPVEVHSLDNGCEGSSEPQQLPIEQIEYQSSLDYSRAETEMGMVPLQKDCSGAESLIIPSDSESEDVVKTKVRGMMKLMGGAVDCEMSWQLLHQTEERRCFTSHQKNSEEEAKELLDSFHSLSSSKLCEQGVLTLRCQETKILNHNESWWPSWVKSLLETDFFGDCDAHPNDNNNKCKGYCVDCRNGALCSCCLTFHRDHRVIKVRRTLYEDAVNVSSIQMCLDITGVETHIANCTSIVVSLKRSVPSRRRKGITGACLVCQRHLPDRFKFCSIGCKNEHELAVCGPSEID